LEVLLVIDMQEGMLADSPKYDLPGVLARIDRLAGCVRARGGRVLFVQHEGRAGEPFAPGTPSWRLLGAISRAPEDVVVSKIWNDAFYETFLESELRRLAAQRLLISGWATDMCVDATVRSAAVRGFEVVVVSDGHTVAARPHASAEQVIAHHHWIWTELIASRPVQLQSARELSSSPVGPASL
jgi:nicotinamidase-related amidase